MTTVSSDNPSRSIRIAGIQCAVQKEKSNTIDRVLTFTHRALEKNARLIVYPECFTLPWFHNVSRQDYKQMAESIPGPSTEPFLKLSLDNDAVYVCPVYYVQNDSYYFSSAIIQKGNILGIYKKIHLASIENWNEQALAEPGCELLCLDIGFAKLGLAMGWDAFFPEAFCAMRMNDVQMVAVPTAAALGSNFRWLSVLASHAVCNNLFIVRINRCGTEDNLSFYGESFCVDPFGNLIDEPTFHRDSLMVCDFKLDDVASARKEFPILEQRRPDVYGIYDSNLITGNRNNEV
jgi:predicted amidohydrolase